MVNRQLPFFLVAFFSWLVIDGTELVASTIAKPNCQDHCGNVSISFPFGIGSPSCYLDEWFEIVCNNSTSPPKPFLKLTNLEVLNISTEEFYYYGALSGSSKLQGRNPITFMNCTDKEAIEPLNLTDSPFIFSVSHNKFVAVSCNVLALMSLNSNEAKISDGCSSICSTSNNSSACIGVNCCQTTIPSSTTAYNTTFQPLTPEAEKACKYAFVVDQDWFNSRSSTNFVAIRDMAYVPVTLEWSLYRSEVELFGRKLDGKSEENYCEEYNSTSSVYPTLLQCRCNDGFKGNPYIDGGCQGGDKICGDDTCVNSVGSYECKKPKTNKILIDCTN